MRAAAAPGGEAITLSGSGTTIQSGVEITQVPARVTVQSTVKLTLSDKYDYSSQYTWACEGIGNACTYEALIEGDGDWTITIEPLKDGGDISCEGEGPYVSDSSRSPAHPSSPSASMLPAWRASWRTPSFAWTTRIIQHVGVRWVGQHSIVSIHTV